MKKIEQIGQFFWYQGHHVLDLAYCLALFQVSPELFRIVDLILYNTLMLAFGLSVPGYWVVVEFTKGVTKAYKLLLVSIMFVSTALFLAGLYHPGIAVALSPVWAILVTASLLSRGWRLFKGQRPEELKLNRMSWWVVLSAMIIIVIISGFTVVKGFFFENPSDNRYLLQEVKKQAVNIQQNKAETQQVNAKTDQLVVGLTLSLSNQAVMLSELKQTKRENAQLKRALAATNRAVNRSATTVNQIQSSQVEVKKDLQVAQAKVDTLKAVVASVVILPDTTRADTTKAIVRTKADSTVVEHQNWWQRNFGRKRKK